MFVVTNLSTSFTVACHVAQDSNTDLLHTQYTSLTQ